MIKTFITLPVSFSEIIFMPLRHKDKKEHNGFYLCFLLSLCLNGNVIPMV